MHKSISFFTKISLAFTLVFTPYLSIASPLPEPYASVDPVLPYDDHGWFRDENAEGLKRLIKSRKANVVIEVGSWLGKSTRFIAKHLPKNGKVFAVDHWLGSSEHIFKGHQTERLPTLYEQFLSNVIQANLTSKIVPVRMSSLEAVRVLQHLRPQIVYIDASHETKFVLADLRAWYPIVKAANGVLCGDDWGWKSVRAAVKQFASKNNLSIHHKGNFWELRKK